MDILSSIGSQLDPLELQVNEVAAKNPDHVFLNIFEYDYRYSEALEELNTLLTSNTEQDFSYNYFSLENWDGGMEGLIGDAWFNFVEFIKKVVRTIKTAISHFIQGMGFKLKYLEDMRIKLRSGKEFNILEFESTKMMAYTKADYESLFRALDLLRRTLDTLFNKQDFDLDGIMDFRQYGIVFNNGAIVRDLGNDQKSSEFSFGYKQVGNKDLGQLGWNMSSIVTMLDKLVEVLRYDMKKDFDYIRFQSAMDKLIRDKTNEKKRDYEEIRRLTNIAKSMAAMVAYNTNITWKMTRQMTGMLKALEAPVKKPREDEVYY